MDNSLKRRCKARLARVRRVRKSIRGTPEKPRFSVSRTNSHLYVQLIDDANGVTLAAAGTMGKTQADGCDKKSKESARKIGFQLALAAKAKNIETVVFDRGRYKFHGIVAELANSAREAGLRF